MPTASNIACTVRRMSLSGTRTAMSSGTANRPSAMASPQVASETEPDLINPQPQTGEPLRQGFVLSRAEEVTWR